MKARNRGRPRKTGLDAFLINNKLIENLENITYKFGHEGFGLAIRLLAALYTNEGYFIKWDSSEIDGFVRNIRSEKMLITDIVEELITFGFFDKNMYQDYEILTSIDIQKYYFKAVSRRDIVYNKEFLLLNEGINVDNKSISVNDKSFNANNKSINVSIKSEDEDTKENYKSRVNSLKSLFKDKD